LVCPKGRNYYPTSATYLICNGGWIPRCAEVMFRLAKLRAPHTGKGSGEVNWGKEKITTPYYTGSDGLAVVV